MKTVLITGASRGIGRAIAIEFANKNYNVVINYNKSETQAVELKKELINAGKNVEIFKADITKKNEVTNMIKFILEKFGKIDVLINNAGISLIKPFADTYEEEWDNIINVNLKGVYLVTKEVIDNMIHNKCGSIVNISSVWGINGASCEVAYSTSKSAIIGFTKALAKEMALSNISVNAVAPGLIDTEMNVNIDNIKEIIEEIPMNRIGKPEEVAKVVAWLTEAKYITGQIINVDGGWQI